MTRLIDKATTWLAHPLVLLGSFLLIVGWLVGLPFFGLTNFYQLLINTGTTIVTFNMAFVIHNSQNRSDKAMHAKLDALIRHSEADNILEHVEELSEKEIDELRSRLSKGASI